MQLWQLDIVYGPRLVDVVTGELREGRIVTGLDDHSRYCVLARVVERATGRAICLAFAAALERYGAPEEVLTDNGKQFSDRFGRGGEVLFDKICRRNGITHRLTAPRSPTTTGKIERFHLTLRRALLEDAGPSSRCWRRTPRSMTGCATTTPIGRINNWRNRFWTPSLEAAGVKHRRIYDLRHTYATWSLAAGIHIFALARRMGTSVKMIDRTYGHLVAGADAYERELLDAFDKTRREAFRHEAAEDAA